MSLWFDLWVRGEGSLGRMVIQCVAPLGKMEPDDIGIYDVTVDGKFAGRLEHRYGDGAWELARRAIGLQTGEKQ